MGSLLIERDLTECGVSEYDREVFTMSRSWPTGGRLSCRGRNFEAVWTPDV